MHQQALSAHQRMRSKLKQPSSAEPATSRLSLPRKQKAKRSGQPHDFNRGNWQTH